MLLKKRFKRTSNGKKAPEKGNTEYLLLHEKKDIITTEEAINISQDSIFKLNNLWIADTRICTLYSHGEGFKVIHSEEKRKQILVFYIGNFFVELSKLPGKLNLVRCHKLGIIPTQEQEEYVDFTTLQPFPFYEENWTDYEHTTLESLKEVSDVHQMKKYLQNH